MLTLSMFSQLLKRSETSTEVVQRQAFEYATRTSNTELLAVLAAAPGLVADLDEAIALRDELDVLLAWASRPGRQKDAIVKRFAAEKRATLLLDLARTRGLPEELYEQFSKRKSVTVNWALLANESVGHDLKVKLAETLGAGTKVENSGLYEKLTPLYKQDDDVFIAFVDNLTNPYALRVLVQSITADTPLPRVDSLVRAAQRLSANGNSYDGLSLLERMLGSDLPDEARETVETVTESVLKQDGVDVPYGVHDTLRRSRTRRSLDLDALLADVTNATSSSGLAAAAATYESTMRDLRIPFNSTELAQSVVSNPNCDAALMSAHRRGFTRENSVMHARRAINTRDLELAQMVFQLSYFNQIDAFSVMYQESEDGADLVSWIVGDSKEAPGYVTSASALLEDRSVAIKVLPAATTLKDFRYGEMVAEMLSESLGSHREKWRMFTTLAEEWSGSFTSLLEATLTLSDE